jgi:hypothetical protein
VFRHQAWFSDFYVCVSFQICQGCHCFMRVVSPNQDIRVFHNITLM